MNVTYTFLDYTLPPHTQQSLDLYAEKKLEPGGFLKAVLCNDLIGSVSRADSLNLENLPAIVAYVYNKLPAACWGSPENFNNWLNNKEEELTDAFVKLDPPTDHFYD
jgi:hypothetical protein